jgi:hypothetical protein
MSKFQQKAEAQTKQIIGQMLGDELLVEEGKEQQREATEPGRGPHDKGRPRPRHRPRRARTGAAAGQGARPAGEQGGPRRRPAGKEAEGLG